MKKLLILVLLINLCTFAKAQTEANRLKNQELSNDRYMAEDVKDHFKGLDLSMLWTITENQFIYGFIGNEHQRIYIKFIKVTKSPSKAHVYEVFGKSMVKNNVCDFHGTITITNIRKVKFTSTGVDNEYKNKGIKGQYRTLGDYNFAENKTQPHSGIFKGHFETNFYVDKNNNVNYDALEKEADGFNNNQFAGIWIPYNGKTNKICNWGDYRILNSGDFDGGAGEFSPTDKYLKLGWQSVRDAYGNGPNAKAALKAEQTKWWK
ncbi:hypothetical protein SAMN05216464_112117 [Mucilaginibacter pineti]|uniref:Uncharacterized protein n=1 Tax=Mucilaginibacter pineti TaxID=1391627 RepID=A0A1G7I216_9SPHI|nr:hypothetical protein [Mucilaginibacter pineti]SDF06623.1 hypothetical protein SAMN05216464_112117 [Mucilaginibacter pineti]